MYCEIILSQRFPKNLGIFDYQVPESLLSQIKIGQLVSIPFRSQELEGVVIKIKATAISGKNIKSVSKILQPNPILTAEQIKLAVWLADYYFVSLGTVIKMMLPPIPKRETAEKKVLTGNLPPPKLDANINALIKDFYQKPGKSYLFWPQTYGQEQQFLYWTLKKIKRQALVIVPEISDGQNILQALPKKIQPKTALIHSQLKKSDFYRAYQGIISGQIKIVIGTKLALFVPLIKPELIIITQAEDQNHKQSDQNPRYDSLKVAARLAELYQAKLLLISHAPNVDTYQDILQKNRTLLRTPEQATPEISLIDMREERKKRNYSVFSEELIRSVNQALANKQNAFLFINRRGASSSVICQDCGRVLTCTQCSLPLAHHATNNGPQATSYLYCHRCNKKSELPPFCPKCSGVSFRFTGLGTQKVETEAKKLWPQEKICRIDSDTVNISAKNCRIIIGTEFAIDRLAWQTIGLIGIVSADILLYLPDFRSTERTWQVLNKLKYCSNCPIVVQSYTPDNPAVHFFTLQKYEKFYETELKERSMLSYPPFTSLVKLIFLQADKAACLREAQRLNSVLGTSPLKTNILTPLKPYNLGKWQMYVIIKYQSPEQDELLKKIITAVPDSWKIDRDPDTLL